MLLTVNNGVIMGQESNTEQIDTGVLRSTQGERGPGQTPLGATNITMPFVFPWEVDEINCLRALSLFLNE